MSERVDKFAMLQEAALTITAELSLDLALQKIVDVAKDLAQARYAALGVAREDRKGLAQFIVSGVTKEEIQAIGYWPRGLGLLGALLQDPRPLRVQDIHQDPRSIGFPPRHPKMTNFLGVPIISRGRILGNFYLTEKIGASEFSQEDEDLVVALAAFAAVAINNARLYTSTNTRLRRKIEAAEKSERQMRFLVDLGGLLPVGPILEELPLEEALRRATALLGDVCAAYFVDADRHVTRKVVVHRDPNRAEAAREFIEPAWDVLCDHVILNNRSVFVADADAVSTPFFTPEADLRAQRFSAAMVLPISSAKQVYGMFFSLASQPLRFSPEDLSFGLLFAQRLGIATENAILLRQLREALKTRDEFISIATHELRTPAATLKGYVDLAIRHTRASPEKLPPILETIKKQAVRVATLADELLDVSRITAGKLELHREKLNLAALVTEVIHRFGAQLTTEDQARLKQRVAESEMEGEWDAMRMEQVLTNLLSNAFKYSPEGGEVEITVERRDQQAMVSVRDRGVGIPQDQCEKVFEPFFRATTAARVKAAGAGLGLSISKEIVERHGGQMWFESAEGQGSTFHFALPLEGSLTP